MAFVIASFLAGRPHTRKVIILCYATLSIKCCVILRKCYVRLYCDYVCGLITNVLMAVIKLIT